MMACLTIALILPNHYYPWTSFHQEAIAFIAFTPIIIINIFKNNHTPSASSIFLILIAFYALLQLSLGVIEYNGDAWLYFFYFSMASLTVYAGSRNDFKEYALNLFWSAWLIAGIISWGMMLYQWMQLDIFYLLIIDMKPDGRPYANLAQPNHVATALWMSCASIYYFYSKRKIGNFSSALALACFTHGLALTQTRTVLVVFLFLIIFLLLKIKCLESSNLKKFIIFTLSVYLAFSLINPWLHEFYYAHESKSALTREVHTHRLRFLEQALYATLHHPWLGYGFGQIPSAQIDTIFFINATKEAYTISFHNIIADIFVWMGIPAGLLTILFFSKKIVEFIKKSQSSADFSALISIIAIGTHALLEFPFFYSYFLLPACFLVGTLEKTKTIAAIKYKLIFKSIAFFSIMLGGKIAIEYQCHWEKIWEETAYFNVGFEKNTALEKPKFLILDQLDGLNEAKKSRPQKETKKSQILEIERITKRFPTDSEIFKYSIFLGLNHEEKEAEKYLSILCAVHSENICRERINEWVNVHTKKWPELANVNLPISR